MRDFRKYEVWQISHKVTLYVYSITKGFPDVEKYALVQQIRRASYSISTNFAEGCAKISEKDFARFIDIALGSATELDYLLELSKDLKYITNDTFFELQEKVISIKKLLLITTKNS
jgi:four helix bundle protein